MTCEIDTSKVCKVDMNKVSERYLLKTIRTKGILDFIDQPTDVKTVDRGWVTRQFFTIISKNKMKTIAISHLTEDGSYFTQKDKWCELIVEGILWDGTLPFIKKGTSTYSGFKILDAYVEKNDSTPEPLNVPENRQSIPGYTEWRNTIISRDRHCVVCGGNKSLEAHHMYGYKKYPALRTDVENGVTLCKYCHDRYHAYYGVKDITPNKFIQYLQQFMVR